MFRALIEFLISAVVSSSLLSKPDDRVLCIVLSSVDGAVSYFAHIFFSFFLAFLQLSYGFSLIKTYKLHCFYFILYSETTNRSEITVINNVYIWPQSLHFYMLQIYCLPNKFFSVDCLMISLNSSLELSRFPPCSPSFKGAILDSKLENVGPALSSLLCTGAYA